jgi:hypothetical protein
VSSWPKKEAEQYLRKLGRKHKVKIHWIKGRDWQYKAAASETARMVDIPRPYNVRQFLVALHEFGHIVGPMPNSRRLDYDMTPGEFKLMMEAAAWAWAMEHVPDTIYHKHVTLRAVAATAGTGLCSHAWSVLCDA